MAGKVSDEELLHALRCVEPLVQKIGVKPRDPKAKIHFLDLKNVSFISTTTNYPVPADLGFNASAVFACDDGQFWYNNMNLTEIEELFANGGNPWFLRTRDNLIVNVKKIRKQQTSDARDLWLDGYEEPIKNAVSRDDYLEAYMACPYIVGK